MRYELSVAGGTFDHFHKGHEAFLRSALAVSDRLLLGLTSDEYVTRRKSTGSPLQSYDERRRGVLTFLKAEGALDRVEIEPIDTLMIPEKWAASPIRAIIVTDDTAAGAQAINVSRDGLPPLDVVIVDTLTNASGKKISSTDIRAGLTDSEGAFYFLESLRGKDLILPESERHHFAEPFGELYAEPKDVLRVDASLLVTVGDAVTKAANELGLSQKLSVVDYKVQRKPLYHKPQDLGFGGSEVLLTATNPASHITPSLTTAVIQAIAAFPTANRLLLKVTGEEDLAVIPLILLLPLGFNILYGQPGEGVVCLEVSATTKSRARELSRLFQPI